MKIVIIVQDLKRIDRQKLMAMLAVDRTPYHVVGHITASRPIRFSLCNTRRSRSSRSFRITKIGLRETIVKPRDIAQLLWSLLGGSPTVTNSGGRYLQSSNCSSEDNGHYNKPHKGGPRRRKIFPYKQGLYPRKVFPLLIQRRIEDNDGLGTSRWGERGFSWLCQDRFPYTHREKRDDIHQAFLIHGRIKTYWDYLVNYPLCYFNKYATERQRRN